MASSMTPDRCVSSRSLGNFWSRKRNKGVGLAARVGRDEVRGADDWKDAPFVGMFMRKMASWRLGSGARVSGQHKTGMKRRRNGISRGSIPGRAQVLAADAVKPGRLTSLARRGDRPAIEAGRVCDLLLGCSPHSQPEAIEITFTNCNY